MHSSIYLPLALREQRLLFLANVGQERLALSDLPLPSLLPTTHLPLSLFRRQPLLLLVLLSLRQASHERANARPGPLEAPLACCLFKSMCFICP